MSRVKINNLFPTPVMQVDECLSREALAQFTRAATHNSDITNNRSENLHHSAMHSAAENATDDAIGQQLRASVAPHLATLGEMLFGQTLDWSIKEYWFNRLKKGGAQSIHAHANSFISGIVFLTRSHSSARTVFHRPLGGQDYKFTHAGPNVQIGEHNADRWVSPPPEPGSVLLYPSYLLHEVPCNEGAERLTLAFNAIPEYLDSHGYRIHFSSAAP